MTRTCTQGGLSRGVDRVARHQGDPRPLLAVQLGSDIINSLPVPQMHRPVVGYLEDRLSHEIRRQAGYRLKRVRDLDNASIFTDFGVGCGAVQAAGFCRCRVIACCSWRFGR